jgi:hypothetical protein
MGNVILKLIFRPIFFILRPFFLRPIFVLLVAAAFVQVAAAGTVTASAPCVLGTANWVANSLGISEAGTFSASFDATPQANGINANVALSQGDPGAYNDLAVIVRFNANGNIDVRNGDRYTADYSQLYSANSSYHFLLMVNVPAHTYSVFVTPPGGTQQTIASNYAFRTEQSTAASLNYWTTHLNLSNDTVQVCNFSLADAPSAISISPASASLQTNATQQFTATVSGTTNTAVTWSTTGGTISSTGLYIAPNPAGTYIVTATSVADSTQSASATVTVSAPTIGTASIGFVQVAAATPQSPVSTLSVTYPFGQAAGDLNVVVVGWNDTSSIVNSVTDDQGNPYLLAIGPTQGINLSQSIYFAPNIKAGSNTVTVTFNQAAVYADVRVLEYTGLAPVLPLDVISGAGGNSTMADSGTATTTAPDELIFGANMVAYGTGGPGTNFVSRIITVPDSDLAEDRVVSAIGSHSASAPTTGGNWVMQMATFKGAAGGAATPGIAVSISPTSSSMVTGGTQQFSATVSGTTSTRVTWSVASGGGTISASGLYTAPSTAGTASVVATSVADSRSSALANVTINASVTVLLSASPTSVSFGSVLVGGSASQAVTLSNTGNSAVAVSSASLTGSGFSLSGLTFPFTLAAGSSQTAAVTFAPSSTGTASGTVSFVSNATNSPATVALIGSGTAPLQHTATLSWQPSTSGIAGYNVYRSSVSGGPYTPLNSTLDITASYADSTVLSGQTYYYVVTEVSSTGMESGYSNQVTAVIPTP